MSQRPGPKPTPKKPLPKPPPKPRPTPRPNPDIPRPSPLPPRIPLPDDRGPVPPPRGPRGPADQPLPLPPRGPIPPGGQRGPADEPLPTPIPTQSGPNRIILNFAGGQYGVRNDAEAERIANKYGLSITRRPQDNSAIPNYILSGNTTQEILANIQKEAGIGFAELDQVQRTQPIRQDYNSAMAQQTYNNLMQQQMANAAAQGSAFTPIQQQQPVRPAAQPNQQAMQNYQNLVGQGIANMQAMGRITPPGQLPNQPQRKPSTSSFQTPRPFG